MDTNLALIKTHTRRRTGSTGNWEPAQGGDVSARHVAAGVGGKVGGVASPADTMRIPQPAQQPERQPHEIWILPQKHRHTSDRSPGARRHPAAERRDARNGRIHHRAHSYRNRSRSSIARSTCGHSFASCPDTSKRTSSCSVGGDVASGRVCTGNGAARCAGGACGLGAEAVDANAARMPATTSPAGHTSPTESWVVIPQAGLTQASTARTSTMVVRSSSWWPQYWQRKEEMCPSATTRQTASRRREVLRIRTPLNRYGFSSCGRPIGAGKMLFFFRIGQFGPDFMPVVRPQVLASHRAVGRGFDCLASGNWHRPLPQRPLTHQDGRHPDGAGQF